jgi:hypothetical protein
MQHSAWKLLPGAVGLDPLPDDAVRASQETVPASPRRPGLLLVDPRLPVRRLVVDMLDDMRLRAAEAEHAAQAAALLGALGEREGGTDAPALLIVAVATPRDLGDGRALAADVARRHPATCPPGVIYTGEHVAVLGGAALTRDERFLVEPFGRAALARAVHGLLGRPVPRWLQERAAVPA